MGYKLDKPQPFFRRLAKDVTANTIAISAASLVPLMAMVGGGVDASRYYMAETRLQAACDAGALAARRAMDKDGFTTEHQTIGLNFFDHNYPDKTFGLENLSRQYTADADGIVNGTASGKMPTTIMAVFGYNDFNINVGCSADINISNTDIVFVLDVTGSMNWNPDGSVWGGADSKINSLRASALTFYDTVDDATSDSAQVRYGIVPYSQQVNVGNSIPTQYMKTSHTYQSREAAWTTTTTYGDYESDTINYSRTGGGYNYIVEETGNIGDAHGFSGSSINTASGDECRNTYRVDFWDIDPRPDPSGWTQVSQSGTDPRTTTYEGVVNYGLWYWTGWNWNSSNGQCTVDYNYYRYDGQSTITEVESREEIEVQTFAWNYAPVNWNISNVYSSGSVSLPTGWEEANQTHTWAGCIEEADTVATATWDPVESNAYDLNIDLVPSTDAEKWAPMLPSLSYVRRNDGASYNSSGDWVLGELESTEDKTGGYEICPKSARKLAEFASRSDLENWLSASNGFTATGNTYHDIGMIWGARFITPDGIFSSENTSAPNGESISRHIVFMTDGALVPINYAYNPYGLEWWDRRVTTDGSSAQLYDRHASRFQAACRAARNKNISVWVVAFGTTLTQNLIDCATPGRAYSASDAASLDSAFREIAEKIAALRLTS